MSLGSQSSAQKGFSSTRHSFSAKNCREAQEQGKTFHYAWLLLSILLVVGELLKDNQFPNIEKNLPEAIWYNSLRATKDAMRIREIKVFWIFTEASIQTWINYRPWLSPILYNRLHNATEFKADMHNLYIQARKDPNQTWVKLSFIAMEDAIFEVMVASPPKWHTPNLAELENIAP